MRAPVRRGMNCAVAEISARQQRLSVGDFKPMEFLVNSISTMLDSSSLVTRQDLPGSGKSCRVNRQFLPPRRYLAFKTKA
jgi:hypothetical protein